jgi:hypothetical protein
MHQGANVEVIVRDELRAQMHEELQRALARKPKKETCAAVPNLRPVLRNDWI